MNTDAKNLSGVLAALGALLGDRLSTARAVCAHHATGETYHAPRAPDAVVFPETTGEARYRPSPEALPPEVHNLLCRGRNQCSPRHGFAMREGIANPLEPVEALPFSRKRPDM